MRLIKQVVLFKGGVIDYKQRTEIDSLHDVIRHLILVEDQFDHVTRTLPLIM